MKISKTAWRKNWLSSIYEFSDRAYQSKIWLGNVPDRQGSFTEAVCSYFDDLDLEAGYSKYTENGFVTKEEAEAVEPFHKKLEAYEPKDEHNQLQIISDPNWHAVVEEALKARTQLCKLIKDDSELSIIK